MSSHDFATKSYDFSRAAAQPDEPVFARGARRGGRGGARGGGTECMPPLEGTAQRAPVESRDCSKAELLLLVERLVGLYYVSSPAGALSSDLRPQPDWSKGSMPRSSAPRAGGGAPGGEEAPALARVRKDPRDHPEPPHPQLTAQRDAP